MRISDRSSDVCSSDLRIFDHLWRGIMRAGEENIVHSAKHHPNQKPVALMVWCLSFLPAGTAIDPFMGSGSTGVASIRAGRPFVGIELNETYFEIAYEGLRKEHAPPNMFNIKQPNTKH